MQKGGQRCHRFRIYSTPTTDTSSTATRHKMQGTVDTRCAINIYSARNVIVALTWTRPLSANANATTRAPSPYHIHEDATESAITTNATTNFVASMLHQIYRERAYKALFSELQRRANLRADKWALEVRAHSVKCRACSTTIKLHPQYTFYGVNWREHKKRCWWLKQEIAHTEVIAIQLSALCRTERDSILTTLICL